MILLFLFLHSCYTAYSLFHQDCGVIWDILGVHGGKKVENHCQRVFLILSKNLFSCNPSPETVCNSVFCYFIFIIFMSSTSKDIIFYWALGDLMPSGRRSKQFSDVVMTWYFCSFADINTNLNVSYCSSLFPLMELISLSFYEQLLRQHIY